MEQLIELARKFKGFLAFAALIFLGLIWLLPKLFPSGLVGLPPDQFVTIIQMIFGCFFGVTVLLILLTFKKSDPTTAGTVFITVHETDDKTAGIAGAEVRLSLPVPEKKITDEKGSVSFHYGSDHAGKKFPVNASKDGYHTRKPLDAEMKNGHQIWIPLKRNEKKDQKETAKSKPDHPKPSTALPPLPRCPFIAGPKIEDPRLFAGRKDDIRFLIQRMTGVQPISVNVIGARRIGKSSLLYHFYQTWRQRVEHPQKFAVIYLSLQDAHFQTCTGFYQSIGAKLSSVLEDPAITVEYAQHFSDLLDQMKQNHILPVICLDEFEMFLKNTQEFTDGFYDHLRSLMDNNALMMIIASHHPLDDYRKQHRLTSSFFNVGHTLELKVFTDAEADDLVRLPASTVPGLEPALEPEFQKIAKTWGKHHPFLLQLAATSLCHAAEDGKDPAWAEQQFKEQSARFDIKPQH